MFAIVHRLQFWLPFFTDFLAFFSFDSKINFHLNSSPSAARLALASDQMPMLTAPSTIVSSPLLPTICVFIVYRLPCLRLFHRYDLPLIFQGAHFPTHLGSIRKGIESHRLAQVKISIKEKKSHEEIAKQNLPN
ncbi:hypothetical protein Prudu_013797 [Prunus dulcis]|uniref:Uncharacterized protein n=1 Tax=Prunus dulcis TaxID=3755 RepID=A0A4Y1RFK7_PRUDU|nr:hypothetical protein Prudu_013797 [Prunus dulcis]